MKLKKILLVFAVVTAWMAMADPWARSRTEATQSVQAALDRVFPGWRTSENEVDLGPGLRAASKANGAYVDSVMTHPLKKRPVVLSREVEVPMGYPILTVRASADVRGDWVFTARVDGKVVATQLVSHASPVRLEVPLVKWCGKKVKIELVNAANGWNFENAYWHEIEIADGRKTLRGPQLRGMKLGGHVGEMMDRSFANGVTQKNADCLAAVFSKEKIGKKPAWACEFWGKWMMTAAPVWEYTGTAALKEKMDRTIAFLLANQYPDGYLGDTPLNKRLNKNSWDIWCRKYTLFGLLAYEKATGDRRARDAACRLVDNLMSAVGPGKHDICLSGTHHGFSAMGILQATAQLYARTGEKKYLQFSCYIADQMENGPESAHLISNACAGKMPFAYSRYTVPHAWQNTCKAYEMTTCHIGLLDCFRIAGVADCRAAAVKYADAVARTEMMLTGAGSSEEQWFHGADFQTYAPYNPAEGCTKATWMHFCRELLETTGDARWADEFEKTLLNGYLAAYSPDSSRFCYYQQTFGRRGSDSHHNQCGMPTHCCNEIGPHGFVDLLESVALTDGDAVYVAQYVPGSFTLARKNDSVEIVEETDYPASGKIKLTVNPSAPARFAVKVRVPGWLGGGAGGWQTFVREWKRGDTIELDWPMSLAVHRQQGHLAFTVGPILLSRDTRYRDGDLAETLELPAKPQLRVDAQPHPGRWLSYVLSMKTEDAVIRFDDVKVTHRDIHFCDFASAANTWSDASRCRTWIPTFYRRPPER